MAYIRYCCVILKIFYRTCSPIFTGPKKIFTRQKFLLFYSLYFVTTKLSWTLVPYKMCYVECAQQNNLDQLNDGKGKEQFWIFVMNGHAFIFSCECVHVYAYCNTDLSFFTCMLLSLFCNLLISHQISSLNLCFGYNLVVVTM